MNLIFSILLFVVGLVLIVKGADWLTDGAASVAHRFGVSSLVVGLTVVAFGTSAPEFVVSVMGALHGNADIALGNVVGSNIFNILAIIGLTALVRPIIVDRGNIRYDVPFIVLAAAVVFIITLDHVFDGSQTKDIVSRTDGLLLLCLMTVFLSYSLAIAKKSPDAADTADAADVSLRKTLLLVVTGLVCLVVGGNWMVSGASGIATQAGVSQSLIALTIVSWGTSAPELAASVMAARKGDTAMALGNVVGSNVFNIFFVLGTTAVIQPLQVVGITSVDIITLTASSVLLWLFCRFGKTHYTVTRTEGVALLLVAAVYYGRMIYMA